MAIRVEDWDFCRVEDSFFFFSWQGFVFVYGVEDCLFLYLLANLEGSMPSYLPTSCVNPMLTCVKANSLVQDFWRVMDDKPPYVPPISLHPPQVIVGGLMMLIA